MKKLFFSAVALVAFSGVSMANNFFQNNDDNLLFSIEKQKQVLITDSCILKAIAFLDALDPNNELSSVAANAYYQGYLDACYLDTKKKGLGAN